MAQINVSKIENGRDVKTPRIVNNALTTDQPIRWSISGKRFEPLAHEPINEKPSHINAMENNAIICPASEKKWLIKKFIIAVYSK